MALTPFGTTGGVFDPFSSLMGPAFDPFSRRGGFGGGLGGGLDLSDLMGRGFGGDVLAPFGAVGGGAQWPMDVMEFPDRFEIRADAPGFAPDEVHINQDGKTITVSGRHSEKKEEKDQAGRVWRSERVSRSFRRSFTMPENVKPDEISAHLDKGVLSVHIPKTQEAVTQPKRIEVKLGASQAQQVTGTSGQ